MPKRLSLSDLPAHIRAQIPEEAPANSLPKQGRYTRSPAEDRTEDGRVFDSKWEKNGYLLLKKLVGLDRIQLQVKYPLLPGYHRGNRKIQAVTWTADFVVDNKLVLDTKGHQTGEFKLRRKMFELFYGVPVICWSDQRDPWKNMENLKTFIYGETPKIKGGNRYRLQDWPEDSGQRVSQ